jgi:hypothetical protein
VAVYSDADRNTMHVAMADEAIRYRYSSEICVQKDRIAILSRKVLKTLKKLLIVWLSLKIEEIQRYRSKQ